MTIHDALRIGRVKPDLWPRLAVCIKPNGKVYLDDTLASEIARVLERGNVATVKVSKPLLKSNDLAIHHNEWPLWTKAIEALKDDTDKGIGDTVERTIGVANSNAFKAWYFTRFGKSCGCSERQNRWNLQYPYTMP